MIMKIPEIPDADLVLALERVRPIVMGGDRRLWNIELPDLRRTAYPWSPKLTTRATGLRYVGSIRTLHRYAYHGFFKPSIAEVIAQLPEGRTDVVAFLVEGPGDVHDLNREKEALDAGFHVARTLLFAREDTP